MKQAVSALVIPGILILVLIIVVIISNTKKSENEFSQIVINGNSLLTDAEYLKSAGLNNAAGLKLSAADIRDRLLKHPYIHDAMISTVKPGVAEVKVEEKRIVARLLASQSEHLISGAGELIKLLPGTRNPDVPVISGIKGDAKLKLAEKEMGKLTAAFKYVLASAVDSIVMEKNLSEIDIMNDGPMLVTFSGLDPVFIIDNKNIERQTAYMYNFLKTRQDYSTALQSAKYIDVRFNKKIFIGS